MDEKKKEIRSFVIRAARTSAAQKRALNDLYPLYGLPFPGQKVELASLFPDKQRLIVEVGFGNGEATLEIAQAQPDTGFLGIEVHPPGVGHVLLAIEKLGLKNLKLLKWDAVEFLNQAEPGLIDGFHVFFPDPWQKKRHHKRRLLQRPFVETLTRLVKTGGYIYIATDWEEYAVEVLDLLRTIPELENPFPDYASGLAWRPSTKFEKRGIAENRPIREIFFRKRSLP